jgi:putative sterol carrier protein
MAFETIMANLTASATKAEALGKTLKFDFGDNKIFIDGTGSGNLISTEDKEANCTVSLSQEDMLGLMNGTLNGMTAFMSGKIKVAGEMGVAMKMQSLFK